MTASSRNSTKNVAKRYSTAPEDAVTGAASGRCCKKGVRTVILPRQVLLNRALSRIKATASTAPGAKQSSRRAGFCVSPASLTRYAAASAAGTTPAST